MTTETRPPRKTLHEMLDEVSLQDLINRNLLMYPFEQCLQEDMDRRLDEAAKPKAKEN